MHQIQRQILRWLRRKNTGLEPSTVKVFAEYVPFLSRVEGLNSMMEISQSADQQLERRIRRKILNVSM